MSLARYSFLVVAVALATLALAWPLSPRAFESRGAAAILLGTTIAALNTIAAYGLLRWARGRSFALFMRAVLGGMAARVALMLGALLLGVRVLELPQLPLVVALLAYFALFLTIELAIVQRPAPAGAVR